MLAAMYCDGLGVERDERKAFQLTMRSAQAGYPLAQYEAATALLEGRGTHRMSTRRFVCWMEEFIRLAEALQSARKQSFGGGAHA